MTDKPRIEIKPCSNCGFIRPGAVIKTDKNWNCIKCGKSWMPGIKPESNELDEVIPRYLQGFDGYKNMTGKMLLIPVLTGFFCGVLITLVIKFIL